MPYTTISLRQATVAINPDEEGLIQTMRIATAFAILSAVFPCFSDGCRIPQDKFDSRCRMISVEPTSLP